MADIQWREPEQFRIGDSLIFQRYLPDYLPADGWSLHYTLSQPTPNGAQIALTFNSSTATDSISHGVSINNFAANLADGDYLLTGQAVNGAEKHTICYGELTLLADLPDGQAAAPVTTHAQRMITLLEQKLETLETQALQESDVQRSRFLIEDRNKTLERLNFYYEKRNYELKIQRANNTGQNQNILVPLHNGQW